MQEAAKLGFKRMFIPQANIDGWKKPRGIELVGVENVAEALRISLGGS